MGLKLLCFPSCFAARTRFIPVPNIGTRHGHVIGCLGALLMLCSWTVHAQQNSLTVSNTVVTQAAYVEVSRGPHSRVMQRTTTWTNAAGNTITRTNAYTEIGTGLSVLHNGKWVPASDQIQITPPTGRRRPTASIPFF
jgi:hypothetical protein